MESVALTRVYVCLCRKYIRWANVGVCQNKCIQRVCDSGDLHMFLSHSSSLMGLRYVTCRNTSVHLHTHTHTHTQSVISLLLITRSNCEWSLVFPTREFPLLAAASLSMCVSVSKKWLHAAPPGTFEVHTHTHTHTHKPHKNLNQIMFALRQVTAASYGTCCFPLHSLTHTHTHLFKEVMTHHGRRGGKKRR